MANFNGTNCVVIDLETQHPAAEVPSGWEDKAALGLSLGAYYDYADGRVHWFDRATVLDTMQELLVRQPMIISFNGTGFDGPLMYEVALASHSQVLTLAEPWHALWERSYDLLREVWQADAREPYHKGVNSLDALAWANGLGRKTGDGAMAPVRWREGQYAAVLNSCQYDVYLTKGLAERVADAWGWLLRTTFPLMVRWLRRTRYDELRIMPPGMAERGLDAADE